HVDVSLAPILLVIFLHSTSAHPVLRSFPTRRSSDLLFVHGVHSISSAADAARALKPFAGAYAELLFGIGLLGASLLAAAILPIRSEEHTSELQSRVDLVCRLLLEKKKL